MAASHDESMNAGAVVPRLIDRINAHDLDGICALLTLDHCFVDSLGNLTEGRPAMRIAWGAYFRMVPDYRIEVERLFEDGPHVAAFGWAEGTYSADGELRREDRWRTPAAWRARVRDELLAEWQVFADNEPIRQRILAASRPPLPRRRE
jgi:ketosteroid isomerase-like protein